MLFLYVIFLFRLESYKRTEDDDGELLAQLQQKDEQIEKLQNIIEEYKVSFASIYFLYLNCINWR